MMCEIINDRNAAFDPANFHPSFYGFEGIKGLLYLVGRDAPRVCCDYDRQTVSNIEFADHLCGELSPLIVISVHRKGRTFLRKSYIACLPFSIGVESKGFDCSK